MNVELLECNISHAEILFRWANDLDVRKNAFNQKTIEWSEHVEWLSKKLASPSTLLYILKIDDTCIGQIRFDLNDQEEWVIDYSIDQLYRGRGYGKLIIQFGLETIMKSGKNVIAHVKSNNLASIHVF